MHPPDPSMHPLGDKKCTPLTEMHPPKSAKCTPSAVSIKIYAQIQDKIEDTHEGYPLFYFDIPERKGLEGINPTCRWQVGGDGSTEPNNSFRHRRKCKRVPSGVLSNNACKENGLQCHNIRTGRLFGRITGLAFSD